MTLLLNTLDQPWQGNATAQLQWYVSGLEVRMNDAFGDSCKARVWKDENETCHNDLRRSVWRREIV